MKYTFDLMNAISINIDSKSSEIITIFDDETNELIKARKITTANDKDERFLIIIPEKYLIKKKSRK